MNNRKKNLGEIAPELAPEISGVIWMQSNVGWELVNFVVRLAHESQSVYCGTTKEDICRYFTRRLGEGMVNRQTVELAAVLALLCRRVKDGRNRKIVANYLNSRLSTEREINGRSGKDLLCAVITAVQRDLEKTEEPSARGKM
jgi:hypothetical protein